MKKILLLVGHPIKSAEFKASHALSFLKENSPKDVMIVVTGGYNNFYLDTLGKEGYHDVHTLQSRDNFSNMYSIYSYLKEKDIGQAEIFIPNEKYHFNRLKYAGRLLKMMNSNYQHYELSMITTKEETRKIEYLLCLPYRIYMLIPIISFITFFLRKYLLSSSK